MRVLGLQGSPRKKGNTDFLLSAFLEEAERLGACTRKIDVCRQNILPCEEFVVCEKKGFCPIDDDMKHSIYGLLRQADVVVAASPIFFYGITAQLKALIDRCQTFWARKYRLKLKDPNRKWRRGYLLSVGATRGDNLFEGVHLVIRYFFDAIDARYHGSLTYRGIEKKGDMERHPKVKDDIAEAVRDLLAPFMGRKRVLFLSADGAGRSQMAAAYAQMLAGDRLDVRCAGASPAEKIRKPASLAMQEKGIDMGFRVPESAVSATENWRPDIVVSFQGPGPLKAASVSHTWPLPLPTSDDADLWRALRDEIEDRVRELVGSLESQEAGKRGG